MPFTPSHAVVALPFVRTPLAPAAVAVGAMTPDLPLFVRGTPIRYGWTHDPAWIPVTALVALALLLVWRCVLRPAARPLSPGWFARRLPREWDASPARSARECFARRGEDTPSLRGIAWLALALMLGVATHIVWDAFTHEGRAGVRALPLLDADWGPLPGYKWLQHGTGLLALAILAVAGARWLATAAVTDARPWPAAIRWTWYLSLPAVLVVAAGIGYAQFGPFTPEFTPQHLAYRFLPPVVGIWGAATLALCAAAQFGRRTVSRR